MRMIKNKPLDCKPIKKNDIDMCFIMGNAKNKTEETD